MTKRKSIVPKVSKEMLSYQQGVLMKVYDVSKDLFEKELEKSKGWLLPEEIKSLVEWVWKTFSKRFSNLKDVLQKFFADVVDDILSLLPIEELEVVS